MPKLENKEKVWKLQKKIPASVKDKHIKITSDLSAQTLKPGKQGAI
jgi:hypothetical protein